MYKVATLAAALLVGAATANPISVVDEIKLESYIGTWFQMATSRSTAFFGTGTAYTCERATYACAMDDCSKNNITVLNEGYTPEGDYTFISGYSYVKKHAKDAQRKLHFDGVQFEGSYWVVKLGPINKDGLYDYAVVSGPLTPWWGKTYALYVLAREPDVYKALYEEEVKDWTKRHGFRWYWNKYVKTNQDGCHLDDHEPKYDLGRVAPMLDIDASTLNSAETE